jgi:hypothetical protein
VEKIIAEQLLFSDNIEDDDLGFFLVPYFHQLLICVFGGGFTS